MRLVWSPLALDRALEAKAYIAEDNPRAAERWAAGLVRTVAKLKRHPTLGRVVPEIGLEEYREVRYGRYRVVYRISGNMISILTVRHYSRLIDLDELDLESE
jgi:plasmid stabilization system protein ParE